MKLIYTSIYYLDATIKVYLIVEKIFYKNYIFEIVLDVQPIYKVLYLIMML